MLKLSMREARGVVIAEVSGKLIGGTEYSGEFHSLFKAVLEQGKNKIVVNLRDTSWANSQGIGMLIGAYASVKNAGGELVLAHVVDRIKDILAVTRLSLIFKTFDTEGDAIAYLTNGSAGAPDDSTERRIRRIGPTAYRGTGQPGP